MANIINLNSRRAALQAGLEESVVLTEDQKADALLEKFDSLEGGPCRRTTLGNVLFGDPRNNSPFANEVAMQLRNLPHLRADIFGGGKEGEENYAQLAAQYAPPVEPAS